MTSPIVSKKYIGISAKGLISTSGEKEVTISDGTLFANNADISGTITANAGTIGGFTIDANSIASGSGNTSIKLTSGATGSQPVIQAGTKFSVDANGTLKAEGADIEGTITADGGTIGGWNIDGTNKTLYSGTDKSTVGLKADGSADIPAI